MAHFAELNSNNTVIRVLVIDNIHMIDEHGVEKEQLGIDYLKNLFGSKTIWVQTSYNNKFRKKYAGIGFKYDTQYDRFIEPRPFPSWTLNTFTGEWEAPVLKPNDGNQYIWDETSLVWVKINS